MSSFKDKVVAITGGASGIGLATAKLLAAKGASLSIADNDKDNLEKAAQFFNQASTPCLITVIDVRFSKEVDDWVAATIKHFGKLNYAANCAGVGSPKGRLIADTKDEDWNWVQDINLKGLFWSVRAELQVMEDHGAIVNIASIAGLKGYATQVSYGASKAGVCQVTQTAALEVTNRNIRVNAVCPGYIDTPLTRGESAGSELTEGQGNEMEKFKDASPLKRAGQPEEVGQLITFLLSDDASFITGGIYNVDGGVTA